MSHPDPKAAASLLAYGQPAGYEGAAMWRGYSDAQRAEAVFLRAGDQVHQIADLIRQLAPIPTCPATIEQANAWMFVARAADALAHQLQCAAAVQMAEGEAAGMAAEREQQAKARAAKIKKAVQEQPGVVPVVACPLEVVA